MYTIVSKLEHIEQLLQEQQQMYRESGTLRAPTRKPVLIMTFGPTGVGKSALARAAAAYERVDYSKCVTTLVDDLVENDRVYKEKVDLIIEKYTLEKDGSILLKPSEKMFKEFGQAYVASRFQMGCRETKPEDPTWNCNKQNDLRLFDAIDKGKDIIFETTGAGSRDGEHFFKNDYQWLYDKVNGKYRIVAVFATVTFCELVRRNKRRAVNDLIKYIQNRDGPAPRLPNVLDDKDNNVYRRLTALISQIMDEMTTSCLHPSCRAGGIAGCSCSVDRILIYNNNGDRLQLQLQYNKDMPVDAEQKRHELKNILGIMMHMATTRCAEDQRRDTAGS